MIRFDYDDVMKRHNVLVTFTLAGENYDMTVASISKDDELTMHRELKISSVRQILMQWDEHSHQLEMQEKRKAGEFDDLFSEEDKEYARWELEHDLAKSIDELEFSTRTHNTMQWLGIRTVGELTEKKASELLKFKNFGRRSLTEVEEKLLGLSLTLKQ